MATNKTRKTALEQLADLEGAVEVNLPPSAYLTICGRPQGQAEIALAFVMCREYLEAYAVLKQRADEEREDWPGCALDVWLFAKGVKAALVRYLRSQARDGGAAACLQPTPVKRYLAAAKRAPTREIRGRHLRKRTARVRGGHFPRVD